ncbi:30S ribosomal protein S20 [Vermiphilus pyriformis]|nr:MAG: 30S ribosomal protein S20 [Vermiphilus pyriformis]
MANTKSAKKQARQNIVRRKRNLARKSSIKSAIKKVLSAIAQSDAVETTAELLNDAQAKLARAKTKGLIHTNTAARKVSRLARKVKKYAQDKAS